MKLRNARIVLWQNLCRPAKMYLIKLQIESCKLKIQIKFFKRKLDTKVKKEKSLVGQVNRMVMNTKQ